MTKPICWAMEDADLIKEALKGDHQLSVLFQRICDEWDNMIEGEYFITPDDIKKLEDEIAELEEEVGEKDREIEELQDKVQSLETKLIDREGNENTKRKIKRLEADVDLWEARYRLEAAELKELKKKHQS
jgi:peptidoglycan hydrolase CwlO-like protein